MTRDIPPITIRQSDWFLASSELDNSTHHFARGMNITSPTTLPNSQAIGFSIKVRNSSPHTPNTRPASPNRRPRPNKPARMNRRRSIRPAPAAHANALYGIGDTAARKIPAEPYLIVRFSSLLTVFSLANLSSSLHNRPMAQYINGIL